MRQNDHLPPVEKVEQPILDMPVLGPQFAQARSLLSKSSVSQSTTGAWPSAS